jgi:hypothetical protein
MFGACCERLHDAMTKPANSLFTVAENGILYLAVGYVDTPDGPGWFDEAVLFCPFCGASVQTAEQISSAVRR